jgi:thiosulfate dehydrogenase
MRQTSWQTGLLGAALMLAACGKGGGNGSPGASAGAASAPTSGDRPAATTVHAVGYDPTTWRAPTDSEIPHDSLGASIRRGLALMLHTTDSLPTYAPGHITCSNCHLDAGRSPEGNPITGAAARYPRYLDRAGAVVTLADRVNYCFTRSLSGRRLPVESREMADILAYVSFVSRGVPVGAQVRNGLAAMRDTLSGDQTRGATVYAASCASCHGADGQGGPAVPALWGARSYSVGASMTREERAASFIWRNMPLGRGKSLTPQQAFDVAAYVNSHPRPDMPGKEDDWPTGGTPKDVPYDTKSGHKAFHAPPLLPRAHPGDALVPPPRHVADAAGR